MSNDPKASAGVPGIPVLPEVPMNLHPVAQPGVGVVVSTEKCTASAKAAGFVRHVAIDVSKTKLAKNFRVGQAFGVIPPGLDERGQSHKLRLYSIASPSSGEDGEGNILATTVKRLIDEHHEDHSLFLGVASNWLCNLKPGDEVPVTGPSGKRFLLPANTSLHDYVFFATGTGIAPFRGMVMEVLREQANLPPESRSRIVLVMGSPYATDLLYHQEFLAMQERHANFKYLPTLSREVQADGQRKMYVQERLKTNSDELGFLLSRERTLVYVCGIAGMELGIFQGMAQHLGPNALRQYLQIAPEVAGDISSWTRKMIHKQVQITRRVFLEVY